MTYSSDSIDMSQADFEIKNILLLDDDDLAFALKKLLEERNFIVTSVSNGVEGLHEVMNLDFDVIICDLMMPKMAGDMFYMAVERTKPELCSRFIFLTAYANDPNVNAFLQRVQGATLSKPVEIADLIREIGFVLQHSRSASEESPGDTSAIHG